MTDDERTDMTHGERGKGRRPVRAPSARHVPRAAVRKPRLPEDRPRLAREAYRELRGSAPAAALDDVVRAYGAAGVALAEGDTDAALPLLEWAKAVAPRSASIREAIGIVRYRQGDLTGAASELSAYRRMSGQADQNHLLADCARAAGRHERVREDVEAMVADPRVPRDRVAEGLMVLAGDIADRGDAAAALAVLEGARLLHPPRAEPWHPRVWYLAGDLALRAGDSGRAREYLAAVAAIDEDFLDVDERLAALTSEDG